MSQHLPTTRTFRPFKASLIAAIFIFLPLACLALYEVFFRSSVFDDPNENGAMLILWAFPILYCFAVPLCWLSARGLLAIGVNSRGKFLLGASAIAMLFALLATGLVTRGMYLSTSETLLGFTVFTLLFNASAIPAAACWWQLARPQTPSMKPTSP